MSNTLPALDGTNIEWGKYNVESVISFFICLIIVIGIWWGIKRLHFYKFSKIVCSLGIFSMAIFTSTIIIEITLNGNILQKKAQYWSDSDNLFSYSRDENFIIFMLDAFDSSTFTKLLNINPTYNDILEDFTYYPDTMAGYPFTEFSIPFILSGKWYENERPFSEYQNDVFSNSYLFENLDALGYEISLYDKDAIPQNDVSLRFANIKYGKSRFDSFLEYLRIQYNLVGFKYAPWFIKKTFDVDTSKFDALAFVSNTSSQFDWQTHVFYTGMLHQEVQIESEKHFKFIHLEGAHVPYRYDKEVHVIENGTYEGNVSACVTVIDRYLNKLKDAGVYDNSVIIIMSDHGYNADGGTEGRQNPFFAVKGKGEKKAFKISNHPFSYEDLPALYNDLLEGKQTSEIPILTRTSKKARRFLFYYYLEEDHMYEYLQKGKADNLDTLVPTGNEYIR